MLEKLFAVQARDLEIDALNAEKGQTPAELIEARAKRESLAVRLEEKKKSHAEVRRQVREQELELETLQARRKSATEAALMATSAKEASQYQNQELQFATRVEEIEGDTLPLMERAEALQNDIDALEAELAELQPTLDELSSAEEKRVSAVDKKVSTLSGERDTLTDGIDKTLLKQYEHVRRSKRGVGLALVVDNERCNGCNVRLPIHVIQKVKRGKGITRCPSCGRILFDKANLGEGDDDSPQMA